MVLVRCVWCVCVCGVCGVCVVWCVCDVGRFGVVWIGVVWCGVVWCGVVWCGVVCSCGLTRFGLARWFREAINSRDPPSVGPALTLPFSPVADRPVSCRALCPTRDSAPPSRLPVLPLPSRLPAGSGRRHGRPLSRGRRAGHGCCRGRSAALTPLAIKLDLPEFDALSRRGGGVQRRLQTTIIFSAAISRMIWRGASCERDREAVDRGVWGYPNRAEENPVQSIDRRRERRGWIGSSAGVVT